MAFRNHLILALLVPSLAAGCALPTAKKATGQAQSAEGILRGGLKPASRPATAAPGPASQAGLVSNNGGGVISNNGAGVIGNNAASLSGIVRAPASLISNNGGGVIGNNAAGYRAQGARYRVLGTVTESPLAGATVRLVDAEGKALAGADGKVLTAVTDEQGRYAFRGILPANNLLVVVDLGAKGALKAIAPKGGGEDRKANMDLISTLTTAYILDQYVKGQADQQKTLDKLPPNVEAETRAKAASAFQQSDVAVPATLSDSAVVATVNGLRQRDGAFNEQMETVKRLLIAAGQSDLGSGRLATEVNVGSVGGLLFTADGTLYVNTPYDRRLWKLGADGRLVTAAGKGSAGIESLTGKGGPDAPLTTLRSVMLDGAGRALIFEEDLSTEVEGAPEGARLSWLGADGKLTEISRAFGWSGFAVPGTGDEAIVVSWLAGSNTGNAKIFTVRPGQAPVATKTLSKADSNLIASAEAAGVDAQGGILFLSYEDTDEDFFTVLFKLDPATGAVTKLVTIPDDQDYALDPRGNLFTVTGAGAIEVRKADGTKLTLATKAQVPAAVQDSWLEAGGLAPDGSARLAFGGKVYRVVNGAFTRVIGTDGTAPASGKATDLSITPGGVGVVGTTLFVSDTDNHRVLRITADGQVSTFAGTGRPGKYDDDGVSPDGDGGLATAAAVTEPGILHTDAAGNLYIAENYRLRKVGTDGRISTIYQVPPDDEVYFTDFAVAPDGTVYVSMEVDMPDPKDEDNWITTAKILTIAPGATTATKLVEATGDLAAFVLAVDKAGALHYLAAVDDDLGKLVKWTAQGAQTLKTDAKLHPFELSAGALAIDGQNRAYLTTDTNKVLRLDVATGAFKVLAGTGGTHFNGGGVDQSLDAPGFPAFDADGNFYVADTGHRQIKRIPANQL